MSKSVGQVVGGIIGGIIGAYTGGPSGAVRGYLVGSSLGAAIDPPPGPDLRGPTLDDTRFNSSAYGVALPRLFGTVAVTGNIFYLEYNRYKAIAKKQKTGGKGGGSQGTYTTTTYYATFAVALGEAMPASKVRRIWAGGKLIYSVGEGVDLDTLLQSYKNEGGRPSFTVIDGAPAADAEKFRYYDGTQTEPDSRMEAVLGAGNCPSYEGTAYIMFYDFDLTEYGNGLQGCPIKVELVTVEEVFDSSKFTKIYEASLPYDGYIYDSVAGVWRENLAIVRGLSPGGVTFVLQWIPYYSGNATAKIVQHDTILGNWIANETGEYDTGIFRYPGLTFGAYRNWREWDISSGTIPNNYPDGSIVGWNFSGGIKLSFGGRLYGGIDYDDEPALGAAYGNGSYYIINNSRIVRLRSDGVVLAVRTTVDAGADSYYRLYFDDQYLYCGVRLGTGQLRIWQYDSLTLDLLKTFEFGSFSAAAYHEAFQFAVYGGLIVVGWSRINGVSGGELHYEQWRFKDFNAVQPLSLDAVVGKVMSAAGVSGAYRDLTSLASDVVSGYRITDVSSARANISPLQTAYLFDLIDVGYKIKAVKRGGAATLTIPYSDLGARVSSDSLGVVVKRDRETDTQLPSRYTVNYIDYNREYDSSSQYQDYPSRGTNERKIDVPVVMSATQAAQLADVLVNLSWTERDTYEFILPQKYLGIIPTQIINVEVSPSLFVVLRVTNVNYTVDQRLEVSARRAEPAVYQSSAVGVSVAAPSENVSLVVSPTVVLMDLPAVNSETSIAGFGVAMAANPNWKGGALLRSVDAGQVYDMLQSFGGNGTLGKAANALAAGDYFVMDYAAQLTLNVLAGEFFAITQDQLLAGKNYCAYGADGRWEIIQFQNVTVNSGSSVTLSGLLRGLFGTEWAGSSHAVGDWVVLLDDADNAFIGADLAAIGATRKYKGVTLGQDAQLVNALDFIYRGVNLKPLSPVNVRGYIESEVWYISVDPRTRLPGAQWSTGTAAPMGESAQLFEIEIYDGAILKNTYQSTVPSLVYTAAQQMADFGYLPTTLTVKVFQISASVGRGYPVQKTLVGVADIYGQYVSLLLHFQGEDGSANIIDSSGSNIAVSAYGDAHLAGGALILDGVGDYLAAANNIAFGFGLSDFTVELKLMMNSVPASGSAFTLIDTRTSMGEDAATFYIKNSGGDCNLGYYAGGGGAYIEGASTTLMYAGVVYHIAFVRKSGLIKLFVQGIEQLGFSGSATAAGAIDFGATRPFKIGISQGGVVDAAPVVIHYIRVTKGYARYISNFTPPAGELPDPI